MFHCNRLMRPEDDVLEGAAIFPQGDFRVRPAVKVIENCAGHSPLRYAPKIGDV
jgi:hypothetical protein